MKQLITLIFILFLFKSNAQDNCEVKLKEILGKYSGECANGKANGKGKSEGIDSYEGEFKDGYPEGKGTYVWKDGHYFTGNYKKGNKDGQGNMYYESASGQDSIITGFWKRDKYIGEYEKQYLVIATSGKINKVACRLIDKKGDDIMVTVHQISNGTTLTSPGTLPGVGSVVPVKGTFYLMNTQVLTNNSITKVQGITFPFRAIFTLTNGESTEILFNESGSYDVYIDM